MEKNVNLKGKCFSKANMGQRKKSDFYQTPYSMTRQFLSARFSRGKINSMVLEPACGQGDIVQVLREWFSAVESYDLEDGTDFLTWGGTAPYVVTNPPFNLANQFIEKCLQAAKIGFGLLMPLNYLQGKARYDQFFKSSARKKIQLNLKTVYIFTRMPMLSESIREDGKYPTGMQAYAWYWWEHTTATDPAIRWLDNSEYVLRKKDIQL